MLPNDIPPWKNPTPHLPQSSVNEKLDSLTEKVAAGLKELADIKDFLQARSLRPTPGEPVNHPKPTAELLTLVAERPDLPIIPMVDGEVCGDSSGTWQGEWGSVYIAKCWTGNKGFYVYEEDGYEEGVIYDDAVFSNKPKDALTDEECQVIYDALPWTEAIIVSISPLTIAGCP